MYTGKCTQKYSKGDKETVCFYHVTYAFQREFTLCSSVNVKELLARTDVISDVEVAAMGFEPTTTQLTIQPKWSNFTKWLSALYELQVFMDWNPVAMTARGGDKRTDQIGRQSLDVLGM